MKKTLVAVLAAAMLMTALAVPALAAPKNKGTTFIVPSATTDSVLVGVAKPVTPMGDSVSFGVVGRPTDGTIEHVGGIVVDVVDGDPSTVLELRSFTIDLNTGVVSGIVNDGPRVPLFTLGAVGDGTAVPLYFTSTASNAVLDSGAITGALAGTADITSWPFL